MTATLERTVEDVDITTVAVDRPRDIRRRPLDDWLTLCGAAVGSLAVVWLLYEQVLPFSGKVGFVVCWYLCFLGMYAAITALNHPWPEVKDRMVSAVVHGAFGITALALAAVLVYTFYRGAPALDHLNFYTQDMSSTEPTAPLTSGGIKHALIGTLIEISIAVGVSLPLGVITAVYMTEVGGRFSKVVRTVIEAMTALPDLVAGMFIYAFVILILHAQQTGLTAALALSVTMLPIIARSSDVVLRLVPGGLREASLALGASQWRTVMNVVLPTARAGLGTALVLGVARGIGETAPLLYTTGVNTATQVDPTTNPMNSLPFFAYYTLRSPSDNYITRGYGAACVLLVLVLVLFVIVRVLSRRRGGTL